MTEACDACLRRGHLVGVLARRIAGLLDRPARRQPGLLALSDERLIEATGQAGSDDVRAFVDAFEPNAARRRLRRAEVWAVCRHGSRYPNGLSALDDRPAVLFCRGRAELLGSDGEEPVATIVGTRRASPYGLEVSYELARGLGAAGVTVVSGLALGVDAAAHRGALDGGGGTVAVLACGPDVAYPRRHEGLHREISRMGLVLSEMPPGCEPFRWAFPARNRIMAGLARLTVVVEAGESSGTLITAEVAQQIGRTVAVVPGRVTSRAAAGGNRLLREGAAVVRGPQDALDELFGIGVRTLPENDGTVIDPAERRVLDGVEAGLDVDGICSFAELPASEVRALLAELEARGLVCRDGFSGWTRVAGGA